jgi:protein SCO1/2
MYRIVFLLLSSVFFFSCIQKQREVSISLPYYNDPDFTPLFISNANDLNKKITHTIDTFSFLNQDSTNVTQSIFENKIHVANFIFTSCGSICPIMTSNFKIVANAFNKDSSVVMLSYSVTPWIDKPYVLKKYIQKNGITNLNWQFLTGNKTEIYKLARQSYFAEENIGYSKDSSQFLHTEHVILVDKHKRIRGIYNGTLALEMQHLVEDIKSLQTE